MLWTRPPAHPLTLQQWTADIPRQEKCTCQTCAALHGFSLNHIQLVFITLLNLQRREGSFRQTEEVKYFSPHPCPTLLSWFPLRFCFKTWKRDNQTEKNNSLLNSTLCCSLRDLHMVSALSFSIKGTLRTLEEAKSWC